MSAAPTQAPALPAGQAAEHLVLKLRPDLVVQPQFYEGMTQDVRDVAEFHWSNRSQMRIEAFEVKLPEEALGTPEAERPAALLTVTNSVLEKNAHGPITPYYELPSGPDWGETLRRALAAVQECGTLTATLGNVQCNPPGIKLRCGGQEASAFPSADQVAAYVVGCRDRHAPSTKLRRTIATRTRPAHKARARTWWNR